MFLVKGVEVNTEHGDRKQQGDRSGGARARAGRDTEEFVAPGAPIIRSSTPRPLSFGLVEARKDQPQIIRQIQQPGPENAPAFPVEAPSAPPLPEEEGEMVGDLHTVGVTPLPGHASFAEDVANEFVWLFEYGLEMDGAILNSPERLNGLALLYGVGVLKGYEITFDVLNMQLGQVAATIVPGRNPGSEVWGVLYRVPRRLAEWYNNEPSLLDKAHSAVSPDGSFERVSVTVQEIYRGREVSCITYSGSATARNAFHLLPRDRQTIDPLYAEQLLAIARKQKLPEDYRLSLATIVAPTKIEQPVATGMTAEQNTEPLPVLSDEKSLSARSSQKVVPAPRSVGLVIFALYIVVVLVAVFTLILLQGLGIGSNLLPASFTPLGIPWVVLVYGLIGSCLSCLVSIGRRYVSSPPPFVIISWFARPFVGMILAALIYLLLNTGLFVLGGNAEQHNNLFSLLAVLAGFCEGWLFYKKA